MLLVRNRHARRPWLPRAAIAVALVLAGWTAAQGALPRMAAIPGPLGGPDIAVDVNTMLRRKGPAFTLRDGTGKVYNVTPGSTGKPLVLISHMGFF